MPTSDSETAILGHLATLPDRVQNTSHEVVSGCQAGPYVTSRHYSGTKGSPHPLARRFILTQLFSGPHADGSKPGLACLYMGHIVDTQVAPVLREYWFDSPEEVEKAVARLTADA